MLPAIRAKAAHRAALPVMGKPESPGRNWNLPAGKRGREKILDKLTAGNTFGSCPDRYALSFPERCITSCAGEIAVKTYSWTTGIVK